ncbi:MAG: F0F1 ATP synthase subunit epsilon [Deltaproteobacteria bacterium]|nr:F0F1 ATP synthase subunit epsilon [Deltaproteobacteria bacterium]
MAANSFRIRIVTPERLLLDEEVEEVIAPGAAGEFGVLPDHIAFLTALAPGRLAYKVGGQRHVIAIFGGYAEVADNVMTVLADGAEAARQIDLEAARRAHDEAEDVLKNIDVGAPEFAGARRTVDREAARIAAASEKS